MGMFTLTLNELLEFMPAVGLETYPIFNEEYRETLNTKILNRYDAREIGFETGEMFKFALNRRMHEIMPYYNQLYESELLALDPLKSFKSHSEDTTATESTETTAANAVTDASNTAASKAVNYTMPQVALSGDSDYADSAGDSESSGASTTTSDNTGNSTGNSSTTSTNDVEGFQGSQADLLMRYRETFLNIDVLVIEQLNDLFMGIWDSGNAIISDTTYFGRYY